MLMIIVEEGGGHETGMYWRIHEVLTGTFHGLRFVDEMDPKSKISLPSLFCSTKAVQSRIIG